MIIENEEPVINQHRTDQDDIGGGVFLSEQVLEELQQGEIDGMNFEANRNVNDHPQVEMPGNNNFNNNNGL